MDAATTAITTITASSHHPLHQPLLLPPLQSLHSRESGGPRDRGGVNARPLPKSLGGERRYYGRGEQRRYRRGLAQALPKGRVQAFADGPAQELPEGVAQAIPDRRNGAGRGGLEALQDEGGNGLRLAAAAVVVAVLVIVVLVLVVVLAVMNIPSSAPHDTLMPPPRSPSTPTACSPARQLD